MTIVSQEPKKKKEDGSSILFLSYPSVQSGSDREFDSTNDKPLLRCNETKQKYMHAFVVFYFLTIERNKSLSFSLFSCCLLNSLSDITSVAINSDAIILIWISKSSMFQISS